MTGDSKGEGRRTAESTTEATPGVTPVKHKVTSFAEDAEMMNAFLVEAREHLEAVERRMLALERNPKDIDSIHTVFRSFHTIKGLAGFLDLDGVCKLTHEIETLLNEARHLRVEINPEIADVILQGADRLNLSLRALDRGVCERSSPELAVDETLINRIRRILEGIGKTAAAVAVTAPAPPLTPVAPPLAAAPAEPVAPATPVAPVTPAVTLTPPAPPSPPAPAPPEEPAATSQLSAELLTIKVATSKLDYLVETVGEMITAASLLRSDASQELGSNTRLSGNLTRLAGLIGEVQKTAMSMRMVPMGHLFQRLSRGARDLSRKVEKAIELNIQGEETELDRNIVEGLHDPLMHMIRNSVDHGIEDAATRAAQGKAPVGTIQLSAFHQGGFIVVQIADDGRGLDPAKLKQRAVANGVINENDVLSPEEAYNLVFLPGFSTAEKVTAVSGRGVGMDVVRRHIQKLRGRIEIRSAIGQGTTFTLKLPLTLAVVTGLVVRVGANRYIMPTFAVTEVLRGQDVMIRSIEGRGEVGMLRGMLYPLVRLHRRFQITDACEDPSQALMIIIDSDCGSYCLMTDELIGQQEVVIKNLGEGMQQVPGIAGGAILGDGTIGLILDAAQIPEWSGVHEV